MKESDDLVVEQKFFEYTDLCLEDHENFQNGFDDARTAFNEKDEDEEPFDIAEHAFHAGFREAQYRIKELEEALRFYGHIGNWNGSGHANRIHPSDMEKITDSCCKVHVGIFGGKLARKTLKPDSQ